MLFVDLSMVVAAQIDQIGVVISLVVRHFRIVAGRVWLLAGNVGGLTQNHRISTPRCINSELAWAVWECAAPTTAECQKKFCRI
jgi:hypothetical protein